MRITASPRLVTLLSVMFAVSSVVGGILLALGSSIPISPYVTTISFLIYVGCRIAGARRQRHGWTATVRPKQTLMCNIEGHENVTTV